jgi:hypothetical protein
MRTSFHHQPEAQHPNFQLSTSWQADYPIFRVQSGHGLSDGVRWRPLHRRAIDVPLTDALAFQLDFRISPTGSFASSAAHPFSGDTPSALIPS